MTRTLPLEACQPSQLLLDVEKLRGVFERVDPDDPAYDPIPVVPADRLPLRSDATRAAEIDLAGRVASRERYLEEWVARCHALEAYLEGE